MTSSITSIISLSFAWTILCCFIVDVYSFNNDGLIPLRGFRPIIPRSDPHSSSHQTKSFEVPREYTYVYSNKNTNYGKSLGHQNPLTPSASAIHVTKTKLTAMPVVSASELSERLRSPALEPRIPIFITRNASKILALSRKYKEQKLLEEQEQPLGHEDSDEGDHNTPPSSPVDTLMSTGYQSGSHDNAPNVGQEEGTVTQPQPPQTEEDTAQPEAVPAIGSTDSAEESSSTYSEVNPSYPQNVDSQNEGGTSVDQSSSSSLFQMSSPQPPPSSASTSQDLVEAYHPDLPGKILIPQGYELESVHPITPVAGESSQSPSSSTGDVEEDRSREVGDEQVEYSGGSPSSTSLSSPPSSLSGATRVVASPSVQYSSVGEESYVSSLTSSDRSTESFPSRGESREVVSTPPPHPGPRFYPYHLHHPYRPYLGNFQPVIGNYYASPSSVVTTGPMLPILAISGVPPHAVVKQVAVSPSPEAVPKITRESIQGHPSLTVRQKAYVTRILDDYYRFIIKTKPSLIKTTSTTSAGDDEALTLQRRSNTRLLFSQWKDSIKSFFLPPFGSFGRTLNDPVIPVVVRTIRRKSLMKKKKK